MTRFVEWTRDDRGDDLLEYALLTAVIALAGAVALSIFPGVMQTVYTGWNSATQAIWEPPDPQ